MFRMELAVVQRVFVVTSARNIAHQIRTAMIANLSVRAANLRRAVIRLLAPVSAHRDLWDRLATLVRDLVRRTD